MPGSSELERGVPVGRWWPPEGAKRVMICSYAAATCAIFSTFPLDTIKTRLQTYNYDRVSHCISSLYVEGGVMSFYRGVMATLISSATARAFTMSFYTAQLPFWQRLTGTQSDRALPVTFMSGLVAGAACTLFTCPFEFAKVASQVEALVYRSRGMKEPKRPGSLQAVKDLSRRGGFMRLYGGYTYHMTRDSLGSAIYFSVYEHVKSNMDLVLPPDRSASHPLSVAVAGGICGVVSWVAVYPIDTMKSAYQRDLYNHSLANSLEFYDTVVERPRLRLSLSMYRGLSFSVLRTSLNGVALFSCYELFMRWTDPHS